MSELRAGAPPIASSAALTGPVPGDAMADLLEAPKLFDIEMNELAGIVALVAPYRLSRLQRAQPVQPQTPEDAADGRR
jgi:hypothetical protein